MGRPHDHLLRAADTHARITAGEAHPSESGEAPPAVEELTRSQKRARSQTRNEGGKFA